VQGVVADASLVSSTHLTQMLIQLLWRILRRPRRMLQMLLLHLQPPWKHRVKGG
jgi:hypothetical protein